MADDKLKTGPESPVLDHPGGGPAGDAQAVTKPPVPEEVEGPAKIAGVGTPALLAETCIPATWHEKTEVHAFLTHPPFSGPFSVPPLWLQ